MMRLIAVIFTLTMGQAQAQDCTKLDQSKCEPAVSVEKSTVLDTATIDKMAEEGLPETLEINISKHSRDQVSTETCEKILSGLKVPKGCCADPKCSAREMRKVAKKPRTRDEINMGWCRKYYGNLKQCDDPKIAREWVIKWREDRKKEAETTAIIDDNSSNDEEAKAFQIRARATENDNREWCGKYRRLFADPRACSNDAVILLRQVEEYRTQVANMCRIGCHNPEACTDFIHAYNCVVTGGDIQSQPVKVEQPRSSPPLFHRYDLGLALTGVTAGAYGASAYADYRPPILGHRLVLSSGAGVVFLEDPSKRNTTAIITRGLLEASLSYRFIDKGDFSLAAGVGVTRIGRFGLDKLTSSQIGPELTLKTGSFRLVAAVVNNSGPVNGYLTPGWGIKLVAGWDILHNNKF